MTSISTFRTDCCNRNHDWWTFLSDVPLTNMEVAEFTSYTEASCQEKLLEFGFTFCTLVCGPSLCAEQKPCSAVEALSCQLLHSCRLVGLESFAPMAFNPSIRQPFGDREQYWFLSGTITPEMWQTAESAGMKSRLNVCQTSWMH